MTTNPFADWTNQLLDYQRQYKDAGQAFTSGADAIDLRDAGFGEMNPWVTALDQWWKAASPGATPQVQDFYSKLVDQGKVYLQMTGALNTAFQHAAAAGDSAAQWQEAINNTLTSLKDTFSGRKSDSLGAAGQAIAFWELPLNMWRRAVSSSSVLPGDFLQNVNALSSGRVRDELHGRVDQLLSTPAIGYMREHQEQVQILVKLNIDYQQALQDYSATYGELGVKCVEALQQAIQRRTEEDKPIESLRNLYDLWVDSCEDAYASYVTTDHYVEVYGRLVNSLMALKRHGSMIIDEALGAMNMPTRSEIDTLHRRLQETRREEKTLRAQIESLGETLRAEMESLRDRVRVQEDRKQSGNARADATVNSRSKHAVASKKAAPKSAAKASAKKKSRTKRNQATGNARS